MMRRSDRTTTQACAQRTMSGAHPSTSSIRRAAAGIAVVTLLVFIQLVVVGAVVSGTRDEDATVQRLDTLRSFYATEGGMNMAIRECFRGADEDGDGLVGSISNDGNPANDPAIGTARVSVGASTVSGRTTVSASGRSGVCRRSADAVISGGASLGSGNTNIMCVMARSSNKTPRYSLWNGGSWGANTAMPWSTGGDVLAVVSRACPIRDEIYFACADKNKDLTVAAYNSAGWGTGVDIVPNVAREKDRPFDVAYEQLSGRAMVAYWNDTSNEFGYRIWNGTTLAPQVLMSGSGTNHSHFLALYPRPGSNQILCVCNDHNFDTGLLRTLAKVWDGSAWSPWTVLTTNMTVFNRECFGAAWEAVSGRALVVYSEAGQSQPRSRTWNGTTWSAPTALPTLGSPAKWVRLASVPATDRVLMVAEDGTGNIESVVWSGSTWGTVQQLCTDAGGDDKRRFDLAFEPTTGIALVVYRSKNKNLPLYRTWGGTTWGAELNGPNLNRKIEYVYMVPGLKAGEIFVACSDDTDDLHLMRWYATAFSNATQLETSLSGEAQEPVSLAGAPISWTPAKLISWAEVEPN